jgi:hypothetical protein
MRVWQAAEAMRAGEVWHRAGWIHTALRLRYRHPHFEGSTDGERWERRPFALGEDGRASDWRPWVAP